MKAKIECVKLYMSRRASNIGGNTKKCYYI